jgi:GNAT superfamily N-acetyltransferase
VSAAADADCALRARAEAILDRYHLTGASTLDDPMALMLVDHARPRVWDANHVRRVRAQSDAEIDALLARIDDVYAGQTHRKVLVDTETPDPFEARLALEGWTPDATLQHVLVGPLRLDRVAPGAPPELAIRPAVDDADWTALEELTRLDHLETGNKTGRDPWEPALTRDMVEHRRAKAPEVQAWIAALDGADVGMFSSMPGLDGMGLVEDLFVRAEVRGRGVSIALIAHCVADARARGAGEVIIGSDPGDWPKTLYARLGFRPLWVERAWMRHEPGPST